MMEEAFRTALAELETTGQPPKLDRRTVQLIEATLNPAAPPASLATPTVERLRYAARKLGRRWASYTNPGAQQPAVLEQLRADWPVLRRQLSGLSHEEQVAVLWAMVAGMGFDDGPADARKRHYLEAQAAQHPEVFASLASIPGVQRRSAPAYALYAVEELGACSLEERQALHTQLTEEAQERGAGEAVPLLEVLSRWLTQPVNPVWEAGVA